MSTRSQIAFFEKPTDKLSDFASIIYKHTDGYPDFPGNLYLLIPALRDFNKMRGINDIYYATAHIIYILKKAMFDDARERYDKEASEGKKRYRGYSGHYNSSGRNAKKFEESSSYMYAFLSIGIERNDTYHGDIAYIYRVDLPLKEVRVYKTMKGIWDNAGKKNIEKYVELRYIVPFSAKGKFTERTLKKYAVKGNKK